MPDKSTTSADPLAEFLAANTRVGAKCTVGAAIRTLDPAHAAALEAALAEPTERIQNTAISKVLHSWQLNILPQTIGRHRGRACGCYR